MSPLVDQENQRTKAYAMKTNSIPEWWLKSTLPAPGVVKDLRDFYLVNSWLASVQCRTVSKIILSTLETKKGQLNSV